LRCLIVDDNPEFLQAATRFLEPQGIEIAGVASSGAEGVLLARELQPEVVLLDIKLGDEDGFDFVEQFDALPVILISTYAERDFEDLIAASPALGFLSKTRLSGAAIRDLLATGPRSES
jgi:chemotaxis response regulator CheB